MHFSTLTTSTFIISLCFTSCVMGKEIKSTKENKPTPQMAPSWNAPCRIEVQKPCDFFISGSCTYWQPIQENMSLGVVSNARGAQDLVNGREIDLGFNYKPGFKLGLGMNFNYDSWDTLIEYTWFRGTEHVSKKLDSNNPFITLLPAWQIPDFLNPQYQSGFEKWKLSMDLIDWELGKGYKVGTHLCFRPFIGLRGAFIRQNLRVDYVNFSTANLAIWPSTSIHQSSHSWGIGPRLGFYSNWKFDKGFRIYAEEGLDILFTQYDLNSVQTSAVAVASRYKIKQNDAHFLRAHLDLALGLGWESYFADNKYHLDLSADYSFQVFFNQNMFRTVSSTQAVGKNVVSNGNLYMQGLTVTARFDF